MKLAAKQLTTRDLISDCQLITAIDPGASGAIAQIRVQEPSYSRLPVYHEGDVTGTIINENVEGLIYEKLHTSIPGLHFQLGGFFPEHVPSLLLYEKVGFHHPGQSAVSTSNFSRHCGHVEMAVYSNTRNNKMVEVMSVIPHVWMKQFQQHFNVKWESGMDYAAKVGRKRAIAAVVRERFGLNIPLWATDAVALALLHKVGYHSGTILVPKSGCWSVDQCKENSVKKILRRSSKNAKKKKHAKK